MKKVLSLVLAVIMVLSVVPAMALFSTAAPIAATADVFGETTYTNIALNKPVTSPQGSKSGVTNGSVSDGTAYSQDPYMAVSDSSTCYVEIDLEQTFDLIGIKVVNYYADTRYYHWEAFASDDNTLSIADWTPLAAKNDSAISTTTGKTVILDTALTAKRYVRVYGTYNNKNTGYHFAEIELYSPSQMSRPEKGWDCGSFRADLDDNGTLTISGTGAVGNGSTSASDYPWYGRAADIKKLVVEDGITSIGQRAFTGYGALAEVVLGKDVTALQGMDVFSGGHNKSFVIKGTLTSIGQGAVYGTTVLNVTLEQMSTPDFVRVCSLSSYNYNFIDGLANRGAGTNYNWSVSEDGKVLTLSGDHVKVGTDSSTAASYPWYAAYAESIEEIVVEPGVFYIGAHLADSYPKLKTVTLGPDVCIIKGDAFAHSKISTLNVQGVFTDKYAFISQGVFYDCGSIARVNLSEMTRYQFLTAIAKTSYNTDSVQSAVYGYNEAVDRANAMSKYNEGELSGGKFVFIVNVQNYDVHGTSTTDWKGKMTYASYLVRSSAAGDANLRWVLNITAGGQTRDYTISPSSYYDFSGYGGSSTGGAQILARFAVAVGNDCLPVSNGDVVTINSITVTDLEQGQVVMHSNGTVGTFTVPDSVSIPEVTYHTITWKLDDETLYTATVSDGTVPTYPGQALPAYKTVDGLDYALVVPETTAATADATYTFTYVLTSTVHVTWLNPDGSVNYETDVLVGQNAVYGGTAADYYDADGYTLNEVTIPGNGDAVYEDTTYQISYTQHDTSAAELGLWGDGYENWSNQTQILLRIWDWEGNEIPKICNNTDYYWVLSINGTEYTVEPSSYYAATIIRFEPCLWATPFVPHQGTSYVISASVYRKSDNRMLYHTTNTKTISIANDFVPIHDHNFEAPVFTWDGYTATATHTCADCGYNVAVDVVMSDAVTTPASCTETGVRTYTATVSVGETVYTDEKTEVIPATSHVFGEPTFTWKLTSGVYDATAKHVCTVCGLEEDVSVTVASEVTKEASCAEAGSRLYTATAVVDGQTYTSEKTQSISKLAHTYDTENGVCTVCGTEFVAILDTGTKLTGYATISALFSGATANGTVTFYQDVTHSGRLTPGVLGQNKTIVFDLNGHTLNLTGDSTGGAIFLSRTGQNWTFKNGTINNAGGVAAFVVTGTNCVLTLEDSLTVTSAVAGVFITGTGATLNTEADITVTGANECAIIGNGEKHGTTINVTGGTLTAVDVAIYHPQNGNLTISGGTITGSTAVYAKSGTVSVTGGTLVANGEAAEYAYNGNGCYSTGDALVIDTCGYPGGTAAVSVTGGDFVSANGAPVASYQYGENEAVTGFITGGTFNKALPDELCAGTLETVYDETVGKYVVAEHVEIGDLNGDGVTTVEDVTALLNYLSGNDGALAEGVNADLNGNGTVNIQDVALLLNILAGV